MSVDDGLLRLKMQHGTDGVLVASRHNKRKLATHKNAEPRRSHLNYALRGPSTPEAVAGLAKELMAGVGIHKLKRKDNITAIEVVSSLPVGSSIDLRDYFEGFVCFVERRFGAQNILSADVHLDESAPHCHVLVLPLVGDRLDASGIVGGPAEVNALHDAFFADFAGGYGLRRPARRLTGTVRKNAAHQVLARLYEDSDSALVSGVWPAICAAIESYPEPFMASLGIKAPAPVTAAKTFEQFVLSTGAGPKTLAGETRRDLRLARGACTPIGVDEVAMPQPLPCGGVAESITYFAPLPHVVVARPPTLPTELSDSCAVAPTPKNEQPETRHRDCDLTPESWDGTIGEHLPYQKCLARPPVTLRRC